MNERIEKLEDIGFYTLSNKRAKNVAEKGIQTPLSRCEIILTDKCNFHCVYCRGIKKELKGELTFKEAKEIVNKFAKNKIENIRFSGGEPTKWKVSNMNRNSIDLLKIVAYTKKVCSNIKHIAISTNGSASLSYYKKLVEKGVNDFSISLDACCSSKANIMANTEVNFKHLKKVLSILSKLVYVSVGVVLNEKNNDDLKDIVEFATKLGVSDIRIIPSAQTNQKLNVKYLNKTTKMPILNYRINNIQNNKKVRGITKEDCHRCHLVKDDMAIIKDKHYPCIIYLREQGDAIGNINKSIEEIRKERAIWSLKHNIFIDKICKKNCLDVCVAYNNQVQNFLNLNHKEQK